MLRWWRAIGLAEVPEEVAFGDDDIRMASRSAPSAAAAPSTTADVPRLARVLGSSFSRIAEAQVALLTGRPPPGADDGSPPDVLDTRHRAA